MEKDIYNITYKLGKNEDNLRILGEDFLKNNKNKGCLIIFNKKYSLRSIMQIKKIRKIEFDRKFLLNDKIIDKNFYEVDEFKIKLILNKNICNNSYMFKDCQTLLEVSYKDSLFNEIVNGENYSKESDKKENEVDGENNNSDFTSTIFYKNFQENNEELDLSSITECSKFYKDKSDHSDILYSYKNLSFGKNNYRNLKGMFKNGSLLKSVSFISNWNNVNCIDLSELFSGCSSLSSIPDISEWNTNEVFDMSYLFYKCSSLTFLPDISKWNTTNVNNMSFMFNSCSSLSLLSFSSDWNTNNVKYMMYLFNACSSLSILPDISKWNTNNVDSMKSIFENCSSLFSLPDISKWNVSNVTDISSMFNNCSSLHILPDISKWNIINVTNISEMFYNCHGLSSFPDISNWNTSNVIEMRYLFYHIDLIKSLPDISKWNILVIQLI